VVSGPFETISGKEDRKPEAEGRKEEDIMGLFNKKREEPPAEKQQEMKIFLMRRRCFYDNSQEVSEHIKRA